MAVSSFSGIFTEVLKDYITVDRGKSLILHCKLNNSDVLGHWYKDSNLIISCDRKVVSRDGLWQVLEIKAAMKEDEGIYCFAVKTAIHDVYTKCIVIVRDQTSSNVTRYYPDPLGEQVGVSLQLCSCNVEEGGKITLISEFSTSVDTCTWFKNNHVVPAKHPKSLLQENDHSTAKLIVDNAERPDTGIYVVVAKTYDEKYLCSYANVLVTNDCIRSLYNNQKIPHIWQAPVEFTDVYEMDDVLLTFKVTYDIYTTVKWTKDGADVNFSHRITCETFDNRYLSIRLRDVTCADSGTYFLLLRHDHTSTASVASSAVLTVKRYSQPRPTSCSVTKSLMPTIASVGDGVTFRCAFDISEIKYTYVTWIIGHTTIEKSTHKFKVLCDGTEYILYIPLVTPDMSGEVTCQLRQHVPPRQSILLEKTRTYLAVVPSQIVEEQDLGPMIIKEYHIHSDEKFTHITSGMSSNCRDDTSTFNDTILQFLFCKISSSHFFFEMLNEDEDAFIESVEVKKKDNTERHAAYPTSGDWNISWVRPNKNEWYAIDVCQTNGQYTEVGVSNISCFDIKEPPEDKLFKFRIRTLRPKKKRSNIKFCFIPEEVSLRESIIMKEILPFKEFKKSYLTDIKIGCGTFATVNLVRRRDGELFTAKTTKFVEQCKWKQANREFQMMKTVNHPKTVELIDGFSRKNGNGLIFTMEYLWGGELIERTVDRDSLNELDVIQYVRQIVLALEYLHSIKIAHLDLRPENIICVNRNSRSIKLIDFGMARIIEQAVTLPTTYGSKDFVPPEMIHNELVGTFCDMWSLGVLTYWLLTGQRPFTGTNWIEKSSKITQVQYSFDENQLREISDNAKEFVSFLLRRQPDDRITAIVALNCDWIVRGPEEGRPTKIQVAIRGGMRFVENVTYVQSRWKVLTFVSLALVRFRARRRLNLYLARRHSGRRYSIRLAKRQMNFNFPSTSH